MVLRTPGSSAVTSARHFSVFFEPKFPPVRRLCSSAIVGAQPANWGDLMKFFASIARAFMEARQRQADRIVRDHSYFKRFEAQLTAEKMNVVELAPRRPTADAL